MRTQPAAWVLIPLLFLTATNVFADAPTITYLAVSPTAASSGAQLTVTLTTTNTQSFDAIYFRQPNGTQGRLDPGEQTEQGGGTFNVSYTVPANSAPGTWRVVEVGVTGSDNSSYRFLASDLFPNSSSCPEFENIGILACGSDIVRDGGTFLIQ